MVFLPAMLYISINFARKKEIKKHIISQSLILAISLVFILYFELMVRIVIAIVAVGGWLFLFIKSLKEYKQKDFKTFSFNHKKIGQAIFIALSVSVLMGTIIYLALFIV
jgi:putative membrane protein